MRIIFLCNVTGGAGSEGRSSRTVDTADIIPTMKLRDGGEIGMKIQSDLKR